MNTQIALDALTKLKLNGMAKVYQAAVGRSRITGKSRKENHHVSSIQ